MSKIKFLWKRSKRASMEEAEAAVQDACKSKQDSIGRAREAVQFIEKAHRLHEETLDQEEKNHLSDLAMRAIMESGRYKNG